MNIYIWDLAVHGGGSRGGKHILKDERNRHEEPIADRCYRSRQAARKGTIDRQFARRVPEHSSDLDEKYPRGS